MPSYRAAWLLPISQPPIRDAWIRIERGRIVAFGPTRPGDFTAADEVDLGNVAVLPGLVNAHTHLELSWMRGRIAPAEAFPDWIRSVMNLTSAADPSSDERSRAVPAAIAEARGHGTAVIGDISNTLATSAALASGPMAAVVFHELLGFQSADADRIISKALERVADDPRDIGYTSYDRSSCAIFGIASPVRKDPCGLETGAVRPVEPPSRRIGG